MVACYFLHFVRLIFWVFLHYTFNAIPFPYSRYHSQRVLKNLQRSRLCMIRLLAHPLPPSPISNLSLFLSLPVCRRSSDRERGGGRGAKSYDSEKAWPSVNPSLRSQHRTKNNSYKYLSVFYLPETNIISLRNCC